MSKNNNKFYITTPIYYVNASPHIGHTYTTIAADILARYHRMIGDKTFFLTGTDEHGAKIEEMAVAAGKEPQVFTDEVAASFQLAWDELNISNDNFLRTTDSGHKKAVQKVLQYLYDKDDIYLGKHEGLYCRGCEQYLNEKDLVNGLCPDHKKAPEIMSEESYMFRLSKYKDVILEKIKSDEFKILPIERKNEMVSFYEKEGLNDISFSRKNVKWGIPLSWDASHTTYVWADAFLNYLTGLNWDGAVDRIPEMWPADAHLMSKDILRIHATIWPAMLLSLGLPLPKTLFVHGYFLIDGQKMSKSLGNVIAPGDLVKKYGVDATHYLLASATTFGKDGDVGWGKFDEKYNADLANGLGNLVARTVTMTGKLRDNGGELAEASSIIDLKNKLKKYNNLFFDLSIDAALFEIWDIVRSCDKYISDNTPWKLIGIDNKRAGEILYACLESLRIIAWLAWPFMPYTAEKIWDSLGLNSAEELEKDFFKEIKWGGLKTDAQVKKGDSLFPRLEK